jgi:hypothetical protein
MLIVDGRIRINNDGSDPWEAQNYTDPQSKELGRGPSEIVSTF